MTILKSIFSFVWNHKVSVMVLACIVLLYTTLRLGSNNRYLGSKMVIQAHTFKTRIDELERNHAYTKTPVVYYNQLSPSDRALVDSAAAYLKIKPQNIKSHTKVSTETKSDFHIVLRTSDSFSFTDGHLKLIGIDTNRHIDGTYIYTDNANITLYKAPKKFLGVKAGIFGNDDYIDVSFDNPKTKITGLTHIETKKFTQPKRIGIGLQVGYTYMMEKFRPYVGVGVSLNLIRL